MSAPFLRGLDISFQGDAAAIKAAGFAFAEAELSIGNGLNGSGPGNVRAFQANGLLASVYHYCIYAKTMADGSFAETDPIAQADFFCDQVKKLPPLDYPPIMDVEQPKSKTDAGLPLPKEAIVRWCERFAERVNERLGVYPLFYSYPSYQKLLSGPLEKSETLGRCGFYPADYSSGQVPPDGKLPVQLDPKSRWFMTGPWKTYALWQTGGNVRVSGVPHIVDTNVFAGTVADLRMLWSRGQPAPAGPSAPPPPPPPDAPSPPPQVTTFWKWLLSLLGLGAMAGAAWYLGGRR